MHAHPLSGIHLGLEPPRYRPLQTRSTPPLALPSPPLRRPHLLPHPPPRFHSSRSPPLEGQQPKQNAKRGAPPPPAARQRLPCSLPARPASPQRLSTMGPFTRPLIRLCVRGHGGAPAAAVALRRSLRSAVPCAGPPGTTPAPSPSPLLPSSPLRTVTATDAGPTAPPVSSDGPRPRAAQALLRQRRRCRWLAAADLSAAQRSWAAAVRTQCHARMAACGAPVVQPV